MRKNKLILNHQKGNSQTINLHTCIHRILAKIVVGTTILYIYSKLQEVNPK